MRRFVPIGVAVLSLGAMAPELAEARPGGCLKYDAAGAAAGNFAGGYRRKGAAVGCAAGIRQPRRGERLAGERAVQRQPAYAHELDRHGDPSETGSIRGAPRDEIF